MGLTKRQIVETLAKLPFISNFLVRIYPIVLGVKYSGVSRSDLDKLSQLLTVKKFPKASLKRIGSKHDGGYVLLPEQIAEQYLLSLGVGDNVSFDSAISKSMNHIFLFDHSVEGLPEEIPNSSFFRKLISGEPEQGSITLKECIQLIPWNADILLKIDIEGSEWDVLQNIDIEELNRFRQIVGEFHNLHGIDDKEHYLKIMSVFNKLSGTHELINLHPNNWGGYKVISGVPVPDIIELTYLRKDIYSSFNSTAEFLKIPQEGLDLNSPNNPNSPEIRLSFFID